MLLCIRPCRATSVGMGSEVGTGSDPSHYDVKLSQVCGIRCWWRSRSVRWPPSLGAPSSCNAGSVGAKPGSPRWALACETHPSAFEAPFDIVRRLLAGETVSSSRRFRVAEASLALRPADPVEVWIGASAPPAIDRAARLAEGWIASPSLTRAKARIKADFYRERCAAYGRQPNTVALRRDISPASRRPRRKPCCSMR